MSRVANNPVSIPSGVDVNIAGSLITIKGNKGELSHNVHSLVKVEQEDGVIKTTVNSNSKSANALSGTTRALIQNIVTGVTEGFERKLEIVGVGYRANVAGKALNLSLGFSHPVAFEIPEGISIETPSQTEIVIKGIDKQQVGQVAANIRAYRPPEPYKGKGVRYSDERIVRKEAKKS
ncbi:MAG TPA: 50S ribosomal protein L6 [Thiotrichaceae bacterium]|jgi:large subunit ribosomal protein L6|nr:50S ribosomal protein L6 [Thiotrichaceae bacterium]HIM07908.1 50S ribosomal protein L6 [Gammaproteobacteria bacterium]